MKDKITRGHYQNGKLVPLTKFEIRVLSVRLAEIEPGNRVLEIGGGTGGITIEAARACFPGELLSIEKEVSASALIKKNLEAKGIPNVEVLTGEAPTALEGLGVFDRVIIGGSGGKLEEILHSALNHTKSGGKIVCNFVTLENTAEALAFFKKETKDPEIIQVQISRGDFIGDLTLFRAENPVYILSGVKT